MNIDTALVVSTTVAVIFGGLVVKAMAINPDPEDQATVHMIFCQNAGVGSFGPEGIVPERAVNLLAHHDKRLFQWENDQGVKHSAVGECRWWEHQ